MKIAWIAIALLAVKLIVWMVLRKLYRDWKNEPFVKAWFLP